jgi:glycosyltransferase involved in cell wall biosynthesis
MKIAHFNTFLDGGAAIAAKRIHFGLKNFRRTIVSSEFYCREDSHFPAPQTVPMTASEFKPAPLEAQPESRLWSPLGYQKNKERRNRIIEQHRRHLAERSPLAETFAMAELVQPTELRWAHIQANIVHLHWISFFADFPSFFASIPDSIPIVWTLHDMNPFTGGCHYSDGCVNYRFGCGDCPQLQHPHRQDLSRSGLDVKRSAFAKRKMTVVTPSQWLKDMAQLSPVWPSGVEFHVIRYGLDLQQFFPLDRTLARLKLGLDPTAVIIGFGAADLNAPRKGMQHLINSLRIVQTKMAEKIPEAPHLQGLVFGPGDFVHQSGLPTIHSVGVLDSFEKLRLIYSAVDFMVIPSREDNQPQIGLEAMACGRPVIGFDAGGISEYVRAGQTGLLAALGDENELADRIIQLVASAELRIRLGVQAQDMIKNEFEINRQSERYIELYQAVQQLTGWAQIRHSA